MVVFTCGHCGESVQKPKVEKHYMTKCRNKNPNLSCMDCFKDFFGQDYDEHTKCVTEEERYSGKGFVAKEKKGEKKQNTWVDMLQSVLDEQKGASGNVQRILETVSKHNNTPRKKPKFVNFVKNVCGHKTNQKDIDQAWDLISVKLSDLNNVQNGQKKPPNVNKQKEEEDEKSAVDDKELDSSVENGNIEHLNGENGVANDNITEADNTESKKLSKKELKEERRRKKYEAELQSAAAALSVEDDDETESQTKKKEKKNKNRLDSVNGEENVGKNGKNKKRKRLDTTNSIPEANGHAVVKENGNVPITKEKKKIKVNEEQADESVCLHDQNVATIEEADPNKEKFNWHKVIVSVLEKKGNEMPFKRLQKKVLSEYAECTGQDVDDRIAEKFIKKLKSAPKVKVDKNRVVLEE